jgi:hypothetical protein
MSELIKNVAGASDGSLGHRESRVITEREGDSSPESGSVSADYSISMPIMRSSELALAARTKRGWGPRYQPKLDDGARRDYKVLCEDIDEQLRQLDRYIEDGGVADEASGVVAEIQDLLERLYDCPFGEGESLKSVVVALQSQLNNSEWSDKHVEFAKTAIKYLKTRWIVSSQTADEIDDMIEEFGLDPFRGTVSASDVLVEYRLKRVETQRY